MMYTFDIQLIFTLNNIVTNKRYSNPKKGDSDSHSEQPLFYE